jgi:hypothetical protein
MTMLVAVAECSQCGREVPLDAAELATWRHGQLALEGDVGEGLLVCPDCDAEDRAHEYDEGEAG